MSELRIAGVSLAAARYACELWHYSRCLPGDGVPVRFGVWEDGKFRGVVLFGFGTNGVQMARHLGVPSRCAAELTRVALVAHDAPVSRILAITLRLFARVCPHVQVVYSYADTAQGHSGGIYRAAGWTHDGMSVCRRLRVDGALLHTREVSHRYRTANVATLRGRGHVVEEVIQAPKHRFVKWLCERRSGRPCAPSAGGRSTRSARSTVAL